MESTGRGVGAGMHGTKVAARDPFSGLIRQFLEKWHYAETPYPVLWELFRLENPARNSQIQSFLALQPHDEISASIDLRDDPSFSFKPPTMPRLYPQ